MFSRRLTVLAVLSALLAGCSADWHKERADTQVYGIIAETQQQELSRSRAFTIEPPPAATVELEQLKPLATGAEIEDAVGGPLLETETTELEDSQGTRPAPAEPGTEPLQRPADDTEPNQPPTEGAGPTPNPGEAAVELEPTRAQPAARLDKYSLLEQKGQPVPVPESARVLGLADALLLASRHSREHLSEQESLYLTALALTLEQYRWTPRFRAALSGDMGRSGDEPRLSTWDMGAEVGVLLALPHGGDLSASMDTDFEGDFSKEATQTATSAWTLNLSQPLLRGFGRSIAQEPLVQAERNVVYAVRNFERFRRTFAVDIANRFYRVLQRVDTVRNQWTNYVRFTDVRQMTQALAEADKADEFEVDQARQDELRARNSWVTAVETYELELDRFKITLGLPTEVSIVLDARELDALRRLAVTPPERSLEEAMRIGLKNRLDLMVERDQLADAQRQVGLTADQLRGELTLEASVSIDSKPGVEAVSARFHEGTYGIGLDYDLPVDRFEERNRLRRTQVSLERQRRALSLAEDSVKLEVRQAYRGVQQTIESYGIQQRSLNLARRRVDSTRLLQSLGRARTRDVLESQRAYVAAQNDLTQALVDLFIARLALRRDMGVLEIDERAMWTWQMPERAEDVETNDE